MRQAVSVRKSLIACATGAGFSMQVMASGRQALLGLTQSPRAAQAHFSASIAARRVAADQQYRQSMASIHFADLRFAGAQRWSGSGAIAAPGMAALHQLQAALDQQPRHRFTGARWPSLAP